jgi:hypothetical protein
MTPWFAPGTTTAAVRIERVPAAEIRRRIERVGAAREQQHRDVQGTCGFAGDVHLGNDAAGTLEDARSRGHGGGEIAVIACRPELRPRLGAEDGPDHRQPAPRIEVRSDALGVRAGE